jgi:6-phosphogluconolactonase
MAKSVTPVVNVYPDYKSLSRAGVEGFIHFASLTLRARDQVTVAVSGGRTPVPLYEILANECADRLPWERVHLYWCDERYVSQRDKRSNFRKLHETLLDRIAIPLGNVHPMPTHRKKPEESAVDYERYMRAMFAGEWPTIDVVLLGMGADGHTASLFPHSQAIDEKKRWVVAVEASAEPPTRLTLTLPVLNASRDVCFVVSGEEKADALKSILTGPPDPRRLPASGVRPQDGRLIWWVDEAAFSRTNEADVRGFEVRHFTGPGSG